MQFEYYCVIVMVVLSIFQLSTILMRPLPVKTIKTKIILILDRMFEASTWPLLLLCAKFPKHWWSLRVTCFGAFAFHSVFFNTWCRRNFVVQDSCQAGGISSQPGLGRTAPVINNQVQK